MVASRSRARRSGCRAADRAAPPAAFGYNRRMATDGLTVAVTGPTGDLGIALVSALERSRRVKKIVGMARRPFDPASQGWKKTEYRQGDVQDKKSVREAVKGADVVVHL